MKRFVIAAALLTGIFIIVFADETEHRHLLLNTAQKTGTALVRA